MRAGTSCTSVPSWTKIRYEDKVQYEGCDEEYQCSRVGQGHVHIPATSYWMLR